MPAITNLNGRSRCVLSVTAVDAADLRRSSIPRWIPSQRFLRIFQSV